MPLTSPAPAGRRPFGDISNTHAAQPTPGKRPRHEPAFDADLLREIDDELCFDPDDLDDIADSVGPPPAGDASPLPGLDHGIDMEDDSEWGDLPGLLAIPTGGDLARVFEQHGAIV